MLVQGFLDIERPLINLACRSEADRTFFPAGSIQTCIRGVLRRDSFTSTQRSLSRFPRSRSITSSRSTSSSTSSECRRVLKRGGRIRVSCPNLETIAGLYLTPRTAQQESYMREVIDRFQPGERSLPGYVVNQLFDLGHQFLYDGETLQEALNRAGFVNVVPERPGASADPVFSGIDAHGGDYIAFESLILEAERPG